MTKRIARNVVHLHVTEAQALAWAQGEDIDPKIEDHLIPKRKQGVRGLAEGCDTCFDRLFRVFNRLLKAAEAGHGIRRPQQVIRVAGDRWKFGFFCPQNLFGKEETAAVKRHIRYCAVCRKELTAYKKVIA